MEFHSLDELRLRKEELRRQLDRDDEHIGRLWRSLSARRHDSTRGEAIASLITNGALAIDAFLMVRKLRKNYGALSQLFRKKK